MQGSIGKEREKCESPTTIQVLTGDANNTWLCRLCKSESDRRRHRCSNNHYHHNKHTHRLTGGTDSCRRCTALQQGECCAECTELMKGKIRERGMLRHCLGQTASAKSGARWSASGGEPEAAAAASSSQ